MSLRIAICAAQIPFVRGGAEVLYESLRDELRRRGHQAEIVSLPFLFTKSSQASVALWRLVEKGVIKEYDDVVPLNIFTFTNSFPMMRTSVKTLAELKGLKLAAGGKLRSQVVSALGATPV